MGQNSTLGSDRIAIPEMSTKILCYRLDYTQGRVVSVLFFVGVAVSFFEISVCTYAHEEELGTVSHSQAFATFSGIFTIISTIVAALFVFCCQFSPYDHIETTKRWEFVTTIAATIIVPISLLNFVFLATAVGLFKDYYVPLWSAANCEPGPLSACTRNYGVTAAAIPTILTDISPTASKHYNFIVKMVAILKFTAIILEFVGSFLAFSAAVLSTNFYLRYVAKYPELFKNPELESEKTMQDSVPLKPEQSGIMTAESESYEDINKRILRSETAAMDLLTIRG